MPLGPVIDRLGITGNIDPNDQVTECLVICKVVDFETGRTSLGFYSNEGLDWIAVHGLLAAAQHVNSTCEPTFDPKEDG